MYADTYTCVTQAAGRGKIVYVPLSPSVQGFPPHSRNTQSLFLIQLPRPLCHVFALLSSDHCIHTMASVTIPKIDISPLLDSASTGAEKQQVAIALLDAFTTYGVFYITSPTHPVFSSQKIAEILDATSRLFALDAAEKAHIPKIAPGGFTRGYVPIGGESGSATKELKEGFSYGYEWPSAELQAKLADASLNKLQGPNSWPSQETLNRLDKGQQDAFKSTLQEFYLSVCQVAQGLLQGISLALSLPENELAKYCTSSETISFMRLFHYLPYADQGHAAQIGSR